MIDHLGQWLTSWLLPVNLWSAVLLAGALAVDRALATRSRASLRMALYAPIALRVIVPFSWSILPLRVAGGATIFTPVPDLPAFARTAPAVAHGMSVSRAVAAVYLLVILGLAVRALVRRLWLARALASASPVASVDAPCAVLRHESLGPMVAGLLSPRVVLPEGLLQPANRSALTHVLRHETAHIRRRDPWFSAAIEALTILAWPVAPVWIAAWRVRHLIELACDELALAGAGAAERRLYGHTLLDLAEIRLPGSHAAGALHFGRSLRERIEALASRRHWAYPVQAVAVGSAAVALAACSSVGVSSTQGPSAPPESAGSYAASVATWNVTLRDRCQTFGKRFAGWSDPAVEWRQGPVDGIPASEVAYCRGPDVLAHLDDALWGAEARNVLGQMGKDLAAAYDRRSSQGSYDLCPSDGPVPRVAQGRGQRYQATSEDWNTPGFSCMEFAIDPGHPISFQYRLETDARRFVLTAHGQRPNGDHGVEATLVLRGEIGPDHVLYVAPKLEETWNEVR
jgi:beta-lactamase regulating signal transducer with metallopeptidase domain